MDDRRPICMAAALAAGLWKGFSLWTWLREPVPVVPLKAVLLHGASAADYAVFTVREAAAALPAPGLALIVLPPALACAALAAAAAWTALALKDAVPARARRTAAALVLVGGLAVSARAGFELAAQGLSSAKIAAAVATAKRGRVQEFGRPQSARALTAEELATAKSALLKRPLLRPEKQRGPFDRMLKLEGGAWSVTAAYDSRGGLSRALVRAD